MNTDGDDIENIFWFKKDVRFFLYIELFLIYLFLCKNVLSSNNTETKKSTLVTELGIDLYL